MKRQTRRKKEILFVRLHLGEKQREAFHYPGTLVRTNALFDLRNTRRCRFISASYVRRMRRAIGLSNDPTSTGRRARSISYGHSRTTTTNSVRGPMVVPKQVEWRADE